MRNEVDDRRQDGNAGKLEAPLEHGEIRVEPLRGEQRAARGAGDTHDPADPDALARHGVVQRLHVDAVLLVAFGVEEAHIGRAISARAGAHEHFRDEPAAGMGEQIHVRVLRQRVRERHRIGDGTDRQRAVIERVDAIAVVVEDRGDVLRVVLPELVERDRRARERAVHEHERRRAVRRCIDAPGPGAAALELRQRVALQSVDAFVDLLVHLAHDGICGESGRGVRDDFDAVEQDIAEAAFGAATRRGSPLQASPLQPCRNANGAVARCRLRWRSAARGRRRRLRANEIERVLRAQIQRRAAGDVKHDDVLAGLGGDSHFGATAPLCPDANGLPDATAKSSGPRLRRFTTTRCGGPQTAPAR
jgi:hypothetical protein